MGRFVGILMIFLALFLFGIVSYLYEHRTFPLLGVACFFTGFYFIGLAEHEMKNG